MRRRFGWVVDFFLGGEGEGKRTRQGKYCRVVFAGDARVQTAPFFMLYIIIEQWGFRCSMRKAIANGPRSSIPWAACAVQVGTARRPSSIH